MTSAQKNISDTRLLEEAFEHFNQTSIKLEAKYAELVSETEKLKEKLKEKEEEVKRSEKLALLGETAAALAHEVRNPLGAMKLFTSMLRGDVSDRPESVKLIDQIDKSINNLDNVVSNILQFSKKDKVTFHPVNINAIINEIVSGFRANSAVKAVFKLELEANPFLNANEHGLRQVFHNLVQNALQATKFSGRIGIATRNVEDKIEVCIKDNGGGVSPEIIDKIFDPFITTKNEGTGLGLAVVSQIVKQHGGEIRVKSDDGANFIMILPRGIKSN